MAWASGDPPACRPVAGASGNRPRRPAGRDPAADRSAVPRVGRSGRRHGARSVAWCAEFRLTTTSPGIARTRCPPIAIRASAEAITQLRRDRPGAGQAWSGRIKPRCMTKQSRSSESQMPPRARCSSPSRRSTNAALRRSPAPTARRVGCSPVAANARARDVRRGYEGISSAAPFRGDPHRPIGWHPSPLSTVPHYLLASCILHIAS